MGRAPALVALLAAIAAYDAFASRLPVIGEWPTVAVIALVVIPASMLVALLALPLRDAVRPAALLALAGVGAAITVLLTLAGADSLANVAKLCTVILVGWWFLIFFEHVGLVVLVAALIVPVDIFSVARGPTKHIVENRPHVFDALSIAFPVPGEHSSAQLGLPDVLFFSLFLAATVRFGLRTRLTWLLTALSFGATLALTVGTDVGGLPALPLLSAGFVLANGDLLWRALRGGSATGLPEPRAERGAGPPGT